MVKKLCNCGCKRYLTNEERFWEKVDKTDKCWNWTKHKDKDGYGVFWVNNKDVRAHRYSYELLKNKIPKNMVIDHLCKNTSCVNPKHLEVVTARENTLRGNGAGAVNKRKKYCNRGHLLSGKNILVLKNNHRCCKICNSITAKIRYTKYLTSIGKKRVKRELTIYQQLLNLFNKNNVYSTIEPHDIAKKLNYKTCSFDREIRRLLKNKSIIRIIDKEIISYKKYG